MVSGGTVQYITNTEAHLNIDTIPLTRATRSLLALCACVCVCVSVCGEGVASGNYNITRESPGSMLGGEQMCTCVNLTCMFASWSSFTFMLYLHYLCNAPFTI